jgi:hypothetical protein
LPITAAAAANTIRKESRSGREMFLRVITTGNLIDLNLLCDMPTWESVEPFFQLAAILVW